MSEMELDPRWEWHELRTLGGRVSIMRGGCNHLEVVPVTSVNDDVVAQLCRTCDQQFPPPVQDTP